jgi:tRNA U34 5-carboxymethylaminomethyl modifying GTPase MnmE/TrmE
MLEKAVSGVIAILIIILGTLLLWRWGKKRTLFRSLGGAFILFGAFVFLNSYVEVSGVFTAWATLALALATFLLVEESYRSREQTRRIHEQERDEDKRIINENQKLDFRRRSLDQIVDWVQDVRQEIFSARHAESPAMLIYELRTILSRTTARTEWASKVVGIFGGELETSVKAASDTLRGFISPANNKQIDLQVLIKAFDAVLDAVFKIKTEEML